MTRIVLASASPRRRELLAPIVLGTGRQHVVRPGDIDESVIAGEDPVNYVRRLSLDKAAAVTAAADELVIAADTTVDVDGEIFGKPVDGDDARAMLGRLSGRAHHVHTGVTVLYGDGAATAVETTLVTFATLGPTDIEWYLATGEPFDKAGAYAIQGAGGAFVTSVQGSVSNVVGLPLTTLVDLARSVGVDLLEP